MHPIFALGLVNEKLIPNISWSFLLLWNVLIVGYVQRGEGSKSFGGYVGQMW